MRTLALLLLIVGLALSLDLAWPEILSAESATKQDNNVVRGDRSDTKHAQLDQPVEIGKVHWQRDLEATLKQSKQTGKPVLILFQEVPGCAGCQKFGSEVLSHPLLVEAIETEFLPIVVYNNRASGSDKKMLSRFQEPAWNYQVIRFLDGDGQDIIPRKDRVWSIEGVAGRMIDTLVRTKREVPNYLRTVAASVSQENQEEAAFAMHCFWTGEYQLGKIEGVVSTEAGWLDGREVTLVRYDKKRLSLDRLAKRAAQVRCADKVYTRDGQSLAGLAGGKLDNSYRPARASDQKKQISRWGQIQKVPGINQMQLTKINALAPDQMAAALAWLSPRQRAFLQQAGL